MASVSSSRSEFRSRFADVLARVPSDVVADWAVIELEATTPPWLDTAMQVRVADQVTLVLSGRIILMEAADLWLSPMLQVWSRVGGRGPIRRGTRLTNTFTAEQDGTVEVGNAIPAEWTDTDGSITTDPAKYSYLSGGTTVGLIRWAPGIDPSTALREVAGKGDIGALLMDEAERLDTAAGKAPPGWSHLWLLGPSEIFARVGDVITCSTDNDFGIICHDIGTPLSPDTTLSWEWKVDEIPSLIAENSFASHDYLSIAVEFDDGLDLTYQWSAALEPETVYQCPLAHWSQRETHLVVRCGTTDLGRWVGEERNVYRDRANAIGGPHPSRIMRVWLIAISHFQHRQGRCAYRAISLSDGNPSSPMVNIS
jgi:hypothetical protein